jgi:hypothetical protein
MVRSRYPANWEDIAATVKTAAGWECKECGHAHDTRSDHVLTVHHQDGNPMNNNLDNLVALCQRCHLRTHAGGIGYVPGQKKFWRLEDEIPQTQKDSICCIRETNKTLTFAECETRRERKHLDIKFKECSTRCWIMKKEMEAMIE